MEVLQGVITGLQNKELYAEDEESGALDIAYNLNSVHDYAYYIFSAKVGDDIAEMYDADKVSTNKSYWGTDKMVPVYYVGDTLHTLVRQAENENAEIDHNGALTVYKQALKQALSDVRDYSAAEIKGMEAIAGILK